MPSFSRPLSWSSISDIKGDTTSVRPLLMRAVSWKQSDFPPPVGMIRRTSCPLRVAFMLVSWCDRKFFSLKTVSSRRWASADQGKVPPANCVSSWSWLWLLSCSSRRLFSLMSSFFCFRKTLVCSSMDLISLLIVCKRTFSVRELCCILPAFRKRLRWRRLCW